MRHLLIKLLYLLGLADLIRTLWWRIAYPQKRKDWAIIKEDVKRCRETWENIAKNISSQQGNKKAWVVCHLPMVVTYKLEGIFALVLALAGYKVTFLHYFLDPWRKKFCEVFGFHRFLDFNRAFNLHSNPPLDAALDSFLSKPFEVDDLIELRYHNVDVGRIALSNFLNRNKFDSLDLKDPKTIAVLRDDLRVIQRNILTTESMVAKEKPDLVLFTEKGTSPVAEIFGVLLRQDIHVIQYLNTQHEAGFSFKRYHMDNRHDHPFSLSPESWEKAKKMAWSNQDEDNLVNKLNQAYIDKTWFNRKFLHVGKETKSIEEAKKQLGLDPNKKTAVIFSHVLWDATFFYGKGLFKDYETWLIETVKAAQQNKNVNWIIKLHPDLVWKLKLEGFTGKLRDVNILKSILTENPDHIKIVTPETDIDTYSFFSFTDYCLTVRGTIGMEMACRGVPVLLAGTGRYSGRGFTHEFKSKEEYLETVRSIEKVSDMPAEQKTLACRFAHTMFHVRPWMLKSFKIKRDSLASLKHPLHVNLEPVDSLKTSEDFKNAPEIIPLRKWFEGKEIDLLDL